MPCKRTEVVFAVVFLLSLMHGLNARPKHSNQRSSNAVEEDKHASIDNKNKQQVASFSSNATKESLPTSKPAALLPTELPEEAENSTVWTKADFTTSASITSSNSSPTNDSLLTPAPAQMPATITGTGGFDGASFFGGFVLAIGLSVVCLVVYKVCIRKTSGFNYSQF